MHDILMRSIKELAPSAKKGTDFFVPFFLEYAVDEIVSALKHEDSNHQD